MLPVPPARSSARQGGQRRGGAPLGAALVMAAATLVSCQAPSPAGPRTGAGACAREVHEPLDPRSTQHVLAGAVEPRFASDPPTSGPHLAGPLPSGARSEPLARPVQVALLEEGVVLVQHRPSAAADRDRLEALAGDHVVVAPNPGLDTAVVATAWRWRMRCRAVDLPALRTFVTTHAARGPDRVPAGLSPRGGGRRS